MRFPTFTRTFLTRTRVKLLYFSVELAFWCLKIEFLFRRRVNQQVQNYKTCCFAMR